MPAPPTRIESFSLFGESGDLPDVLHCETIAARSALYGWELAPHRHVRMHQFVLLRRGGGEARLESGLESGSLRLRLRARSLVNVPPGDVHAFSFEPGTEGWVVTLPDELTAELLSGAGDLRRALRQACVVQADPGIERVTGQLGEEFGRHAPARALVLRGLAGTLLGLAARAVLRVREVPTDLTGSNVLRRFEALLEAHFLEHWSVSTYARALAVSPTHLSRVARAATGRSASRLIEERTMREARRHLAFSSAPVKTIGHALGYADPAHFCRAFSRAVGCSPRAFRARLAVLDAGPTPAA